MTESQWVGARRLDGPLRHVVTQEKHRKLRLLACAACDRVRPYLINHHSRAALDALMACPDWELMADCVDRAYRPAQQAVVAVTADASEQRWYHLYESAAQALALGAGPGLADHLDRVLGSCRRARGLAAPPRDEPAAIADEEGHQLQLLRDIFGDLFSRNAILRRWLTGNVSALAGQMYASHDYSALPILADALQDAGCDSADILDHCRAPGPHVRGCWVVDMVLGKE